MNFCIFFALFGFLLAWCNGMLYRRSSDNVLEPDLQAVSSTVLPLPYYSIYGYEKKLLNGKDKKRPPGNIELITKTPD